VYSPTALSTLKEESRYPPLLPAYFQLLPQRLTSADSPRVSPGNHDTAA